MKKIFTLIIASFLVTTMFAQMQPLNPSFETWISGTVTNPEGWETSNMDLGFLGTFVNVTENTTDPQDGTSSIKLETMDPATGPIAGIATLGNLDIVAQTLTGGMAYTDKPTQLTGYYKYAPAATDTAIIGIGFYNGVDTIAEAGMQITTAANTWTQFTINITYTGTLFPDTMNIVLASSIQGTPIVGTVLEVDNLQLIGGSVDVPQNVFDGKYSIHPNPANSFVNISIPNASDSKIKIHNTVGQVVYSKEFNNSNINERIDVSDFNAGIYFVEIINRNNSSIEKLIIK